jgi:hypothetical protein
MLLFGLESFFSPTEQQGVQLKKKGRKESGETRQVS